ncbi:uncharacterized protein LOC111895474 [Lactuca sativa]|uniref:Uncharacterized protein n=1 Tax=Lactuca sativa TaxID=4236 RepID=A0A9R1X668_LACSA|nr:uncharacterized protein LOC111895474 [Lactuca sativa]KAJ0202270.1 hypothetical protein LSAT_V11C600334690 [Lactuca sativa]
MEGLPEDAGDGSMLCTEHPFKNNTPAGGICAFCLQEKLGKLVSSSFPIAVFPSSSSSSPSFRSDIGGGGGSATTVVPPRLTNQTSLLVSNTQITPSNTTNECHYHQYYSNRSRILYLLSQKKKKKKDLNIIVDGGGGHGHDRNKNLMFKRSKSTATPRRGGGMHFMDADNVDGFNSPHKRGFWSFLYLQKHSHSSSSTRKNIRDISSNSMGASASAVGSFPQVQRSRQDKDTIVVEENESPCHASFDRKVSRSRSVGCGSRSFSGDFFERISTGFGDCTLRRVESQREGKSKVSGMRGNGGQDCIKERVRCGGLFSGFMITSSSSSSSSSSYWVASNPNEGTTAGNVNAAGKMTSTGGAGAGAGQNQQHSHGRSKSWGWALASPMRAFSKPSSTKREASNKNQTPNLAAIPSLLSVRS